MSAVTTFASILAQLMLTAGVVSLVLIATTFFLGTLSRISRD